MTICITVLLCVPFSFSMLYNAAEQLNNTLINEADIYVLVYGDAQIIGTSTEENLTERKFYEKNSIFLDSVSEMIKKGSIAKNYIRISDRRVLFLTVSSSQKEAIYTKNYYDHELESFHDAFDDFFQHYENEALETIASRQKFFFDIYGLNIGCYSADAAKDSIEVIEGEGLYDNTDNMVCLISEDKVFQVSTDNVKPLSIGDNISVRLRAETDNGIISGNTYNFRIVGRFRAEKKGDTQVWPDTDYDMIIPIESFAEMISEADRLFYNNKAEETRFYFPYYIFPVVFKVNSLDRLRKVVNLVQQEYPEYEFYSNTENYAVMLSVTESLKDTFTSIKIRFFGVITVALLIIIYLKIYREIKSIAIRSALGQKNAITIIQTIAVTASVFIIAYISGLLISKHIVSLIMDRTLAISLRESETVFSSIINKEPQKMTYHLSIRITDLIVVFVLIAFSIVFEIIMIKHTLTQKKVKEILQKGAI